MDTPQETHEAAIARIRTLWFKEPGAYWDALKEAKLETVQIFPEYAVTDVVILPDFDKPESGKLKQYKKKG